MFNPNTGFQTCQSVCGHVVKAAMAELSYLWSGRVQYMKCGRDNSPLLYLIIPGNPGCAQFYEKFAASLHARTCCAVWAVSHTGHARNAQFHPEREACGLSSQIATKVDFLRDEAFAQAERVVLIGHSIGCYIILHMLERLSDDERGRVAKCVLLFPVIERMALTASGRKMTPALTYARWAWLVAAWALSLLPRSVLETLVPWVVRSKEKCVVDAIIDNLANPRVVDSCTFMALQEMMQVCERDDAIIARHRDKLVFYYGSRDHWCPVDFYSAVSTQHPSSTIYLCERDVEHAFMLRDSDTMAQLVAEWCNHLPS